MDTLAPARTCCHTTFQVCTASATEFVDITEPLVAFTRMSGFVVGTVNIQTTHTTTGLIVNEHEALLLQDFEALLGRLAPREHTYAHDDLTRRAGVDASEPLNGHAHCRALMLPASVVLNIVDGRLALGTWQRVFLAELDGPRERTLTVVAHGVPAL